MNSFMHTRIRALFAHDTTLGLLGHNAARTVLVYQRPLAWGPDQLLGLLDRRGGYK